MKRILFILVLLISGVLPHQAQTKAKPISDITRLSSYGACIMRDGSVSGINENECFAMHSVMKFPQALYVADYLSQKGLALDDTIVVDKADLMEVTSLSPFSPRTHHLRQ